MNYGDSVSIQCNVPSGDLPIGIRWYFNGATINDPSVVVTNVGKRSKVLTIDSVTGWHAGNYSCEASNKPEVVHFTAELFVNGNVYGKHSTLNYFTTLPPRILPFSYGPMQRLLRRLSAAYEKSRFANTDVIFKDRLLGRIGTTV